MAENDDQEIADRRNRRRFVLRRLHSITGIVPVGVFVVGHLWTSANALWGEGRYRAAMRASEERPYGLFVDVGLVLLPLAFHALYGVVIALGARPAIGRHPYNGNWMYLAQRVTGFATLAFVVWHVGQYWWKRVAGSMGADQFYTALCGDLASTWKGVPWVALAFIGGIAASVFHLANGLWGACVTWGITVSRRSQRLAGIAFGLLGLALFMLGANTAIYFATGARVAVFGVPRDAARTALVQTCPLAVEAR